MAHGFALVKAGWDVTFFARRAQAVQALKANGLTVTGIFGKHHVGPDSFHVTTQVPQDEDFDLVLICTKTYSMDRILQVISTSSAFNRSLFLLCQNGWGGAERLGSVVDSARIYHARIITGFERVGDDKVRITVHADDIRVGHISGCSSPLMENVVAAINEIVPCCHTDEIARYLWAKMLYNCALNPLGALLNATYGELADEAHTAAMIRIVVAEVYDVMDDYGFRTFWETSNEYCEHLFAALIPATYAHRSSMLQDLEAGRPTEIDALNGVVSTYAQRAGLRTPVNDTLVHMIKYVTTSREG